MACGEVGGKGRTHEPYDADAGDEEGDEDVAENTGDRHGNEADGRYEWLVSLVFLVKELMKMLDGILDIDRMGITWAQNTQLRKEHQLRNAIPICTA